MIDDVALAVLAVLKAAGLNVTDGTGDVPRPYVEVQILAGPTHRTSLARRSGGWTVYLPLQLVANSPRSVRWLSDRVEAALLDLVLDVDGLTSAPLARSSSTAPDRENAVTPPAWWGTDTYRTVAVRSPSTLGATP